MAKSGRRGEGAGGLGQELRHFRSECRYLHRIIKDTQQALRDVAHVNLFPLESAISEAVRVSGESALRPVAVVALGPARARLINCLLGEPLLPPPSNSSTATAGWRWLRLQHGPRKQLRVSLGTDFEVVEPQLTVESNWDQIPPQDLKRTDTFDLSTVMDIELCNPFLENGVQILVPPDLGDLSLDNKSPYEFTRDSTIKDYEEFYSKRGHLLGNVFPIILYALDELTEKHRIRTTKKKPKPDPIASINGLSKTGTLLSQLKNFKLRPDEEESRAKFYIDLDEVDVSEVIKDPFACELNSVKVANSEEVDDSVEALQWASELEYETFTGLSEENLLDLRQIYELHPNAQILFVLFSDSAEASSEEAVGEPDDKHKLLEKQKAFMTSLVEQLKLISQPMSNTKFTSQWVIIDDKTPSEGVTFNQNGDSKTSDTDIVLKREDFVHHLITFGKSCLKNYIIDDCNKLSELHNALLQQFILFSHDMAREMQIVPKKIQYVAKMEQELYDTLNKKFSGGEKRAEILTIMQRVLQDTKDNINTIDWGGKDSPCHSSSDCINMTSNSTFYEVNDEIPDNTSNNRQEIPADLNDSSIEDIDFSTYYIVNSLWEKSKQNTTQVNEFDTGIDLPHGNSDLINDASVAAQCKRNSRRSQVSFKQASLEVQRGVLARLSRKISVQLVKFVDCLRDSYFGTLQRCLGSLEEDPGGHDASQAVRRILLVAHSVDLQQCASFSFLHALVDHLRRISLSSNSNNSCCVQSPRWRRQVALDTVESLGAARLARLISQQLCERIRQSHEQFQAALQSLGDHHAARLQQTEELKLAVRKKHAPRFARLCLESTSLGDLARHGMPNLAKEIGRGQYGVVYAVKGPWGGFEPCAVKSVVPPDGRHFNELAMEFINTRNIAPHDRIVRLRGSVVDHSYGNGNIAVLLISERLKWDLHCALMHANMSYAQRMQVAVDIVEGIRYLHNQGLLHRDIKMKNVLLDGNNRAKLTDLGFCIPEAMMSGSIVGTPVHMAPELHSGSYDNTVDIYAFGILFWYVCAGDVRLPSHFQNFLSKEQLWSDVCKGLRPERLPQFSEECWQVMSGCWAAEPSKRLLLGDVQPVLERSRDMPPAEGNLTVTGDFTDNFIIF